MAFAPHHLFAVAGIALWGIGSALGFPLGISALSTDPVMTPARVSVLSTVNYGAASSARRSWARPSSAL